MKFLADVNVSRHVVERLRSLGLDIVRVPEVMDARATDVEIIAEARRRGAVVISHDQDFTAILATTGAAQPSLINLRVSFVDVERLARALVAVIEATTPDLEAGAIVTLDDRGARVHLLPIR
jgi:predicted nuclease of predicted toxin-antitoxin system